MTDATSKTSRLPRPPAWLVRSIISLICIVATVAWLVKQPAPELPSEFVDWAFVVGAALLTLVTTSLRGLRWSRILRAAGARDLGTEPYLLTAVGYMGNTVLPARGGDVLRVTLLSRSKMVDWKTTTGTLIPERLLDLAAVSSFLVLLTLLTARTNELGPWPGIGALAALFLGAGVIGGYELLRRRGHFQRLADRVRPFTRPTRVLIHREVGPAVILLSLTIWATETLVLWLVVCGTYEPISLPSAALVVVLVSLASAVPAAPGFIGTFDAAVIFGLHTAGVPSQIALATAVLYRIVVFGPVTLAGAGLLTRRYGGFRAASKRPTADEVLDAALADGEADAAAPAGSVSSSSR